MVFAAVRLAAGFYDGAGRFRLAEPNVNGVLDYVRTPTGQAVINEGRNDENRIIAQIQLAIMKAHNRLIDFGLSFDDAADAGDGLPGGHV